MERIGNNQPVIQPRINPGKQNPHFIYERKQFFDTIQLFTTDVVVNRINASKLE
jgi:hypothetical protein